MKNVIWKVMVGILVLFLIDFLYVYFKDVTPFLAIKGKDSNISYALFYKVWSCDETTHLGSYFEKYACVNNNDDTEDTGVKNLKANALKQLFDKNYFKEQVINQLKSMNGKNGIEMMIDTDNLDYFEIFNLDLIDDSENYIIRYDAKFSCKNNNSCLYFSKVNASELKLFSGLATFKFNDSKQTFEIIDVSTSTAGIDAIIYDE